jgi:ParB-like chromosome segregation protein Spo0J
VNDTSPTTSYVSRVVVLPPGVARQVFDACREDRQQRSPVASLWTVPAGPIHRLELDGAGLTVVPDRTRSWAMRSCPGMLRSARVRGGYHVELELNPWSGARTELGLRFVGWRRPQSRHIAAAGAVVDALASELELRGLLALHPSHLTGATSRQEVSASAWL